MRTVTNAAMPAPVWTLFTILLCSLHGCSPRPEQINRGAPDFMLPDFSGNRFYLNRTRGKIVMLSFWSTWCRPCISEMPALDSLWKELGGSDFILAGICIDESDEHYARAFAAGLNVTFPLLMDSRATVAKAYGVTALPTTVIIDTTGVIRWYARGYTPQSMQEYRGIVRELRGKERIP